MTAAVVPGERRAQRSTASSPHWQAHAESRRARPEPRTREAFLAWFRDAWEASLPRSMHTTARGDVEPGDAWGAQKLTGPWRRRLTSIRPDGWGLTGWDRRGEPRGVDREGLTLDPFLYYLEADLRARGRERIAAEALLRWAYLGWDVEAAAHSAFTERIRLHERPEDWELHLEAHEALLESGARRLEYRCRTEPVRHAVCPDCRRERCECHERSEAQVNAEEAG